MERLRSQSPAFTSRYTSGRLGGVVDALLLDIRASRGLHPGAAGLCFRERDHSRLFAQGDLRVRPGDALPDPTDRRALTRKVSLHRNRNWSKNGQASSQRGLAAVMQPARDTYHLLRRRVRSRSGRRHLAAGGETGYDLYYLCVEMATAQNPPHLTIFGGFEGSGCLASA